MNICAATYPCHFSVHSIYVGSLEDMAVVFYDRPNHDRRAVKRRYVVDHTWFPILYRKVSRTTWQIKWIDADCCLVCRGVNSLRVPGL